MVIKRFSNVLFMFIVNVSNNLFSVILKIFWKCYVFAGYVHILHKADAFFIDQEHYSNRI